MYRPKKPNQEPSGNIRLSKQQGTPSASDFQFLRTQAAESKGRTIELPWVNEKDTYMLTCLVSKDNPDPFWSFYSGDPPGSKLEFQHQTPDLELIQSIIWQNVGGPDMIDSFMSSASAAGKKKEGPGQSEAGYTSQQISAASVAGAAKPTGAELLHAKAIMQGDLSNMQVPTLLQSVGMSKMSGRLQINSKVDRAQIYFNEGVPMHAVSPDGQGETAIIDCLTWVEGDFHFYPNETSPSQTIHKRLDSLLMEGVSLLDQSNYLRQAGLKPDSLLVRVKDNLTQEEFFNAISKGAPVDVQKQSNFYLYADNQRSFTEILRLQPMTKSEWMPIVFNMLSCGLLQLRERTGEHVAALSGDSQEIDRDAIAGVVRALTRAETGLYTYPAFLFFGEQEFARCAAFNGTLSLMVFDLSLRVEGKTEDIPLSYVKELVRRIDTVKRPFDICAHFETFKYACLLPNTSDKAAKVFAQRLLEAVNAQPLVSGSNAQVTGWFGIATAPDDTQDLGALIGLARDARRRAADVGVNIMTLREARS